MTRWLGWSLLAAGVVAAGYLASLNPAPVDLVIVPGRVVQLPLAVVLTAAMAAGALAVGAATTLAALRRTWAGLAARREARQRARSERQAELLAETGGGDLATVVAAAERELETRPDSPRLLRQLRDLYARADRWADALRISERLIVRIRTPSLLEEELGALRALRYQVALGEPDALRGARALRALAREDPRFAAAWVGAGDRLLEAGRRLRARRTWTRGAKHCPVPILLERLEVLDASENRPARTTRVYRRLRRRHPDDLTLQLLFARHLLRRHATDEATTLLETASDSPLTSALRGELARQQGDFERATAALAHALGPRSGLEAGWTCTSCGAEAATWVARCVRCERWNTFAAGERSGRIAQDSSR